MSSKLDYLSGLNVTCVWLQPFYQSPFRDNGYDISDYYQIHPRLGSLGDFVKFTQRARERGIRVIVDLVVNHTSIDHPWFQQARSDPKSPYRDYYIWSKKKPADANKGMVFPGVQKSTWTFDEAAGLYYYHRFYNHEPDLNIANPAVKAEIDKIITTWLQLGVSGFRVDALPFLIELKGPDSETEDYEYLQELRHVLSWHRGDAVFFAEANLPPDQVPDYFGNGNRIHVIFNFWVNQHFYLAMAREQAQPIRGALDGLPQIPWFCEWANFLRTHDELDLGRLSDDERQEVFQAFGPDENMQLYNRGIRRRLAPMLQNNRQRLEMAHSLLLTLPGTPVLRYGDEIGMGEDLSLKERDSIRTPMQWADAKNGGFSSAEKDQLILPVISSGEFGYQKVNVAAQQRDPDSLLSWLERATRLRRRSPEFGSGSYEWLKASDPAVLAHCCQGVDSAVFAVHNLSGREIEVTIELGRKVDYLWDLLANCDEHVDDDGTHRLKLPAYGYRWFREGRGPESLAGV